MVVLGGIAVSSREVPLYGDRETFIDTNIAAIFGDGYVHTTKNNRGIVQQQRAFARLAGSGKDIGQDKPAFGWELEPL